MQNSDSWTGLRLPGEPPAPDSQSTSDISAAIKSLVPALSQTFAVILVGYACVKLNVVHMSHRQGLSLFVTRLALPALLFTGMASLDFSKVNWYFLLAVTIGKIFVFVVAIGVTILLDGKDPRVLGTAGVHAIFVSQSNDFAMGLPIFLPIFGLTHPEYVSYLYLVAPISLVFLNPIGFLLMESCKKDSTKKENLSSKSSFNGLDEIAEGEERVESGGNMRREEKAETVEREEGGRNVGTYHKIGEPKVSDPVVGSDLTAIAIEQSDDLILLLQEGHEKAKDEGIWVVDKNKNTEGNEQERKENNRAGNGEGNEEENIEGRSELTSDKETSLLLPRPKDSHFKYGLPSSFSKQSSEGRCERSGGERRGEGRYNHEIRGPYSKSTSLRKKALSRGPKPGQDKELKFSSGFWKTMYGVISSPVVFMVPVGLLVNLIFQSDIPPIIAAPFKTFGAAFSPLSLFILGMSMADQTEAKEETQVVRLGPLVVALALIAGKCLLLPFVITLILINFHVSTTLVVAGLVFGALPCTPSTFFFASDYGLCEAWIGTATVLGTFLFAPLVYVVAQLAFLVMNHYEAFQVQICDSAHTMAMIGVIGAGWTLIALTISWWKENSKIMDEFHLHQKVVRCLTACIAICWAVSCVGTLTCRFPATATYGLVRYFAIAGGETGAKIFTTLVALSECYCLTRGPLFVNRRKGVIIVLGWVLAVVITSLPFLSTHRVSTVEMPDLMTCWYPYWGPQLMWTGISTGICVSLITFVNLKFIWKQFESAEKSGDKVDWSNIQLLWSPSPHSQSQTPRHLFPPPPLSHTDNPSNRNGINPHIGGREPYFCQGVCETTTCVFGSDGLRKNSPKVSEQDQPPTIIVGTRKFLSVLSTPRRPPTNGANKMLVSPRWKEQTYADEQNSMLLFCSFSVMSMLVTLSICLTALWNKGSISRNSAQGGLLLLLSTVLGCGQGGVLFLSHGIYPGFVNPLVSLREWWISRFNGCNSEETRLPFKWNACVNRESDN